MNLQASPVNEILYVTFNQDFTCIICGTETGYRVYNTDPFRLLHRRDFEHGGGVGVVAMLFRTNILAFAGGGNNPRYQPQKVILFDDRSNRAIAELGFRSVVKQVMLRRELLVVVLEKKVYVYAIRSLQLLDSIETIPNPKGLCCLSFGTDRVTLVCPGMQQGKALVVFYPRNFGEQQTLLERERTIIVAAHDTPVAAMGTDFSGTLLATASEKGTIVRVFDTASGMKLQELRRGLDRAEIHSLAFSSSGDWLSVASDKGTVHIFAVSKAGRESVAVATPGASGASHGSGGGSSSSGKQINSRSSFKSISTVLPAYFSSEWSHAQFRVPDYRCIASFGSDPNTVIIVCANGSYYKVRFDPNRGGEMIKEDFHQFDDESAGTSPRNRRNAFNEAGEAIVTSEAMNTSSGAGAANDTSPCNNETVVVNVGTDSLSQQSVVTTVEPEDTDTPIDVDDKMASRMLHAAGSTQAGAGGYGKAIASPDADEVGA